MDPHEAEIQELRHRCEVLAAALEKLGGVALCVMDDNTPEFMEYLAAQIEVADAVLDAHGFRTRKVLL